MSLVPELHGLPGRARVLRHPEDGFQVFTIPDTGGLLAGDGGCLSLHGVG